MSREQSTQLKSDNDKKKKKIHCTKDMMKDKISHLEDRSGENIQRWHRKKERKIEKITYAKHNKNPSDHLIRAPKERREYG